VSNDIHMNIHTHVVHMLPTFYRLQRAGPWPGFFLGGQEPQTDENGVLELALSESQSIAQSQGVKRALPPEAEKDSTDKSTTFA
jgi:hypothetical protein